MNKPVQKVAFSFTMGHPQVKWNLFQWKFWFGSLMKKGVIKTSFD